LSRIASVAKSAGPKLRDETAGRAVVDGDARPVRDPRRQVWTTLSEQRSRSVIDPIAIGVVAAASYRPGVRRAPNPQLRVQRAFILPPDTLAARIDPERVCCV
jgi:hypothetical protein